MLAPKHGCALFFVALALTVPRSARALPQFARKYKMDCSGCHDALAFPRLNDVGYKFRRAGFRMPETIGQDEVADYTLDNYFSASVQADNTTTLTSQTGSTDQVNTFSGEVSLYALTGSFAKYFASQTELAVTGGAGIEIENAYMRAAYGDQDTWFSARAGIMHPLEGLGGDDRSLGASRPLIFEVPPFQNQDTLLTVPEPSRIGVDVGVQWEDTSLSFEVFNRGRAEVESGEIVPSTLGPDTRSAKDYMIVANQILGTRSSASAYWIHGAIALPRDPAMFAAGTSTATFDDDFDRFAGFVSIGGAKLLGLAGAQVGFDHALDSATGTTSRFRSIGGFAEGNFGITPHVVCFLRFDYFDPSDEASSDQIFRGTLGLLAWDPMISIVPELSVQRTGDVTEAGLLVHARVIY
jgi:hypothetical protein